MLVTGCSHSAGSEIDGTSDSLYNRQHAFGNLLAEKMGYRPINIALLAATNMGIARGVLQWFKEQYDPAKHEVFVLVAWAESTRMEVPIKYSTPHHDGNPFIDWYPDKSADYLFINTASASQIEEYDIIIKRTQRFICDNLEYLEVMGATYALQIQYLLKMLNVNYCMCNTGHMFTKEANHMKLYMDLIDTSRYMNMDTDLNESFFWKYKGAGYVNPKAKYFHHGEEPHALYADELYKFISDNGLANK